MESIPIYLTCLKPLFKQLGIFCAEVGNKISPLLFH
jgi:hypothetical protein